MCTKQKKERVSLVLLSTAPPAGSGAPTFIPFISVADKRTTGNLPQCAKNARGDANYMKQPLNTVGRADIFTDGLVLFPQCVHLFVNTSDLEVEPEKLHLNSAGCF